MSTKSQAARKAAKQTSAKAAEEGLKSARRVFDKFLEKADPEATKKASKLK